VVQADGDDLARSNRNIDLQVAKGDDLGGVVQAKPERFREQIHLLIADFAVNDFALSLESAKRAHGSAKFTRTHAASQDSRSGSLQTADEYRTGSHLGRGLQTAAPSRLIYFGATITKLRTVLYSPIEKGPSFPANQKALDDPPSKLSPRWTFRSPATCG